MYITIEPRPAVLPNFCSTTARVTILCTVPWQCLDGVLFFGGEYHSPTKQRSVTMLGDSGLIQKMCLVNDNQ